MAHVETAGERMSNSRGKSRPGRSAADSTRQDFEHGLIVGKFYPPHAGHEYLIRTAARHCRHVTVTVLGSQVESISLAHRIAWLRDIFGAHPHVRVVGEMDDIRIDYADEAVWQAHIAIMRTAVQQADREFGQAPDVDAVFSSEHYGTRMAGYFAAHAVCLDQARSLYPLSGTAVRNDIARYWLQLAPAVRAGLALRVVVLGAESSGTTTLVRDLVAALQARGGSWGLTRAVAEYGREYSANLLAVARASLPQCRPQQLQWQEQDFVDIAGEQTRMENSAAADGGPVLICDTDALATCIWHERYMGYRSSAVAAIAAALPPRALYLLTDHADVPFEDDGLRDGEHLRPWMTQRFGEVLAGGETLWFTVSGLREQRCRSALQAIDAQFERHLRFTLPLEQRSAP